MAIMQEPLTTVQGQGAVEGNGSWNAGPNSFLKRWEETIRRLIILTFLFALMPGLSAKNPVIDPDIWWHLRTGQWIVEHESLPTTDPFSIYGQGKPWFDYSWLFDLLVYGLYRAFGLVGLVLFRITLSFAIAAVVYRLITRRESRFVPGVGLAAVVCFALTPMVLTERPWLFTVLFSTLTLDAILELRDGARSWTTWLLPICYALWANIHIQFVSGLLLLGLGCAAPLIDQVLGHGRQTEHADTAWSHGWWTLIALTCACVLATLLNPYHVRLFQQVVAYGTQIKSLDIIDEFHPISFRFLTDWIVLILALGAAFALGRRRRLSAFDVLLLGVTAYFSFRWKRDSWFVVLAAASILARTRRRDATPMDRFPLTARRALPLTLGAALVVTAILAWSGNCREAQLQQVVATNYPEKLAAAIERRGDHGPLFNYFNWGGYLIWRLPNLPVSMDGRTNVHGEMRSKRNMETFAGLPGWDADPDFLAASLVFTPIKSALFSLLRSNSHFEMVHCDELGAAFRVMPNNSPSR